MIDFVYLAVIGLLLWLVIIIVVRALSGMIVW